MLINLAGRQRTLTQKMSKEVLIYSAAKAENDASTQKMAKQLRNTMEVFSTTLNALIYSGDVPTSLNLGNTNYRKCAAATGEVLEQLLVVDGMWKRFSQHLENVLSLPLQETKGDLDAIRQQNVPLLKEMNKAVQLKQGKSETRVKLVSWFQYGGISITIFCILYLAVIIQVAIKHLNRDVHSLKFSSSVMRVIAHDIEEACGTVTEYAGAQTSSVENIGASVDEVSSVANSNSQKVKDSREATRDCAQNASQGVEEIHALEDCLSQANGATDDLTDSMQKIKEANSGVSKVISTINEIAFQTNILALNAAVEAARAGDAGAGFAVVANEVRSLALRSAQAAEETNKLINGSIDKSKQAVEASDKVVEVLDKINEQSERIRANFGRIAEKVGGVDQAFNEITTFIEEQNHSIQGVQSSISEISQLARDSSSHADHLAAFSNYLSNEANNLNSLMIDELKMVFGKEAGRLQEKEQREIQAILERLSTRGAQPYSDDMMTTAPRNSNQEPEESFY